MIYSVICNYRGEISNLKILDSYQDTKMEERFFDYLVENGYSFLPRSSNTYYLELDTDRVVGWNVSDNDYRILKRVKSNINKLKMKEYIKKLV